MNSVKNKYIPILFIFFLKLKKSIFDNSFSIFKLVLMRDIREEKITIYNASDMDFIHFVEDRLKSLLNGEDSGRLRKNNCKVVH